MVLNYNGKFKIGRTTYLFEGVNQTMIADLTGLEHKGEKNTLTKVIQCCELSDAKLKSGDVVVAQTMLSDNRLRCLLQLRKEYFGVEGPIIVNGLPDWGIIGYYWSVYYRFYSYKQFLLYKSDRPTYLNWKTGRVLIGGNEGFYPLIDFYNPNPPVQRTTSERSIEHVNIYQNSYLTVAPGIAPPIYQVPGTDFWSDYMMNFHESLIYQ